MEELLPSLALGLGLAASVGFRVFLPLLALSLVSHFGHLPLNDNFEWIGSIPAMATFGFATILEIAGYYIPWIDNALDTIAVPTAAIAGTTAMASTIADIDPLWRWVLAIIGGGGTAALIKGAGANTRFASSTTTGGLGNPLVSSGETVAAAGLSVLSIWLWPVALVVVIVLLIGLIFFFRAMRRFWKRLWGSST